VVGVQHQTVQAERTSTSRLIEIRPKKLARGLLVRQILRLHQNLFAIVRLLLVPRWLQPSQRESHVFVLRLGIAQRVRTAT